MKFRINGREYDPTALTSVTLKQVIAFNRESVREGYGITWADVEDRYKRLEKLPLAAKKSDPDSILLFGMTIWATRIAAGEDLSFADAVDVSLDKIEIFDVESKPSPQLARSKPRKDSGRAVKTARKKASVSARSSSAKTSKAPSTDA